MRIVYLSVTGQTEKFVKKLTDKPIEINPANPFIEVNDPYLLVVPTYEVDITEAINDFIETGTNLLYCKGVVGGGNRNFADLFGFTAKDLARDYDIPLVHLFEFQGSKNDVEYLNKYIKDIEGEIE